MKPHQILLAILVWAWVFMMAVTANRPPHGGWGMNMRYWTMREGEAAPEWFPVPLFHADPAGRQAEPPSLPDPEYLAIGVTTYAEYTNGESTLRMRNACGNLVGVDRSTVSAMPFRVEVGEALYYRLGRRDDDRLEGGERFPLHANGAIARAVYEGEVSDRVVIDGEFWNGDQTSGFATITAFPDGTVQPETARIFLRGFAPRHRYLLGMCAGFATLAAGAVFFLARLLSAKRPPAPAA